MRLTAENITKSFGAKQVLKGINLGVESGRALGLLGRNGAGKTTMIRIIMQVFPADSGRVLLDGKPLDTNQIKIGYLPEERGLYPKKVILEQLLYFAALRGVSARQAKKDALRLLDRLGMGEYANKKLDTLSKGNQQKIQLIATLICDPQIVILDEPFSGLDPVNAMLLEDLVKECIQQGKIVFFSSHQMNYVEEFCNEIAILNQGKIVLSGNIREIKRRYERNRLLISTRQAENVRQWASALPAELVTQVGEQEGDLLVTLADVGKKDAFLSALTAQGFDIDGFRVYEPSLNDIFVSYTEGAV
ncbi:MAG: ATP-binding cassette domain-containing protein [Candidatus Fimivicinus sp.]|nr:ATP-binding cassette domain-containing protein [Oscillospiraceae bacterium]MDY5589957.1 ATP-binding cassette domain-containing protein [Candidatus Fimivicinus sp.]